VSGSDSGHGGERHGTGSHRGSGGGRGQRRQSTRGGQQQWPDRKRSGHHSGGEHRRRHEDRAAGGSRGESGESGRSEVSSRRGDQRFGGSGQRRENADGRARRRPDTAGDKPGYRKDGPEPSAETRRHHDRQREAGQDRPRRFERDGRGSTGRGAGAARPPRAEQGHVEEGRSTGGPRPDEPAIPADVDPRELDAAVRQDLRTISKGLADKVASHLVAAGNLIDEDPQQALRHVRYARHRASRVAAVREANGIVAYQAGEWSEALGELRAARRMGGGPGHLALMADCERALGRPERALEISRSPEALELDEQEAVELRIVAAGARGDLGEVDAAVVSLQIPQLDPQRQEPWSARLFYAYADNLLAAKRTQEAFTWFVHAANADDEGETDAPERLDELLAELGAADDSVTAQGSAGGDEESEREP
jgi:hypothetical protein